MTKLRTLPDSLRDVLHEEELCWLAGEQTLLVARKYVAQNKVTLKDANSVLLDAKVSAEQEFDVHICLLHDGDLDYKCNCPEGSKELFCAHCAAAALIWLSRDYDKIVCWTAIPDNPDVSSSDSVSLALRKHLTSVDQTDLIDVLIDWAEHDSACAQRLLAIPSSSPQLSGHTLTEQQLLGEIDDVFDEHLYVPDDRDEIQMDLGELKQVLERILNQSLVKSDPQLTHKLAKVCLERCHESMDVVEDLGEEEQMAEITEMLAEWMT